MAGYLVTSDQFKEWGKSFVAQWWCSLLLIPLIYYSLQQAYHTLDFNIFFAISYDFPFPVNIIHIFLKNFLLTVHEAGHTILSIFGWRTLTILGGSLFQIFIPLLILGYFWLNRKKIGLQLSLYLVGFSFIDVAFYIADAGARQLPLIGDLPKQYHDWFNLLRQWNALKWDHGIAVAMCLVGSMCYLIAIILPLFFVTYKSADIKLEI